MTSIKGLGNDHELHTWFSSLYQLSKAISCVSAFVQMAKYDTMEEHQEIANRI